MFSSGIIKFLDILIFFGYYLVSLVVKVLFFSFLYSSLFYKRCMFIYLSSAFLYWVCWVRGNFSDGPGHIFFVCV
jgi:hypothetical protein